MVTTRSNSKKGRVYVRRNKEEQVVAMKTKQQQQQQQPRRLSKRLTEKHAKACFATPPHHQDDDSSLAFVSQFTSKSNPQPSNSILQPQLVLSGPGNRLADLLKLHAHDTFMTPHDDGKTRTPQRVTDTGNIDDEKVKRHKRHTINGPTSAVEYLQNFGMNAGTIMQMQQSQEDHLSSSCVQAAFEISPLKPSEAISPVHATKNLKKITKDSKKTEVNACIRELMAEGKKTPHQVILLNSQPPDPVLGGSEMLYMSEKRMGDHSCTVFTNAEVAPRNSNHGCEGRASNCFQGDHRLHLATTSSLNLTEMAEHMDDDLSDIDSFECDSNLVTVNDYKVKPHCADLLRSIISKHGDICANCSLRSIALRSLYMEVLCDTLQKLKKTNLLALTEDELKKMLASVSDIERVSIEVGWLKKRLEEICEAKQAMPLLKPSSDLKKRKAECKTKIQGLESEVHDHERAVGIKLADVYNLQGKLQAAYNELSVATAEAKKVEQMILASKAKVRYVVELGTLENGLI